MSGFEPADPERLRELAEKRRREDALRTTNNGSTVIKPYAGRFKTAWPFVIIAAALAYAVYDWKFDAEVGTPWPGIAFAVVVFLIWYFVIRGKPRDV